MDEVRGTEPVGTRLLRIFPDVTEQTALGRSTIYDEIAAGRLRAIKIGRAVRVRSDDLERWIADRSEAGSPAA